MSFRQLKRLTLGRGGRRLPKRPSPLYGGTLRISTMCRRAAFPSTSTVCLQPLPHMHQASPDISCAHSTQPTRAHAVTRARGCAGKLVFDSKDSTKRFPGTSAPPGLFSVRDIFSNTTLVQRKADGDVDDYPDDMIPGQEAR